MVTDGSPARSPGRATFRPLGLTARATNCVANAVVVFPDGTIHTHALHGNSEVRAAQKQIVQFKALAGTAAPETIKTDAGHAARLQQLQELREAGLLSQEEYDAKRAEIIASI
jgi:Short C-terminal domain